jgi:hypothetical protein
LRHLCGSQRTDKPLKRPRDPAQLAKLMIDIASGEVEDRAPSPSTEGKDAAAVELGRKGGLIQYRSPDALRRSTDSRQNSSQNQFQLVRRLLPLGPFC